MRARAPLRNAHLALVSLQKPLVPMAMQVSSLCGSNTMQAIFWEARSHLTKKEGCTRQIDVKSKCYQLSPFSHADYPGMDKVSCPLLWPTSLRNSAWDPAKTDAESHPSRFALTLFGCNLHKRQREYQRT